MTRLGVTGHQAIPHAGLAGIRDNVASIVAEYPNLVLATSLAAGADQLCAEVALELGGQLHVVVPSANYRRTLTGDDLSRYDRLLASATSVEELPQPEPSEDAFYNAGLRVLDLADVLIAIWDGQPSRGLGGTADIVGDAKKRKIPIRIVWPEGLRRE